MKTHFLLLLGLLMTTMLTTQITGAKELGPHLHKTTLDNKLTVLVKETPGVKIATVQIWVRAGSIYEDKDEAGITHLIEHMIFKGTPTRGPGAVAGEIEEKGGAINAYTSYEQTVYHATLPARYWDTALDVLVDAVLHSTFDPKELEREKKVVLEELHMRNDRPTTKLFQAMMSNSYLVHPYRLPIIGSEESVSSFTRDDILAYMAKHYHPENFVVVVVGDVRYAEVQSKIRELMGNLKPGTYVKPELPQEQPQDKARFFKLAEETAQSHLALTIPIVPFVDPDCPTLDVISSLLGHGDTSRLFHELRDNRGLVYRIHASAFTPHDPGLLEITAVLEEEQVIPALEAALEEVFKLKYLLVSDDELNRIKRNLESDFVFNLERVEGQARVLGSFELLTGDPREDDYLEKIRGVSREDIQKIAKKYFKQNKITAGYLVPKGTELDLDQEKLQAIIAEADEKARQSIPPSQVADAHLTNVHRFTLDNGIRLLVREDNTVPTVALRAVFPGGLRAETEQTNGAFAFIAELLPAATENLPARELSLKIADMAGSINGFNGKNTFGLKGDFLARFFEPGLALFRDVLLTSAFDPQEAEKIRAELLAQLKQQEDSLPSLAFREFNRLIFQGHPYSLNTIGSEIALENLSVRELKKIYEKQAKSNNLVLAVSGDVKAEEVRDLVEKYFGEWQDKTEEQDSGEESFLAPLPPAEPEMFTIERDKEQVHIIIGFLGAMLDSPDRYGLEVLETVLSGQSGRLFTELRDKQSLAYSLSSFAMPGLDTGSFGIYIGTSPDKKDEVIKSVWRELYRVQDEEISPEELNKAKNVLISHYEMSLQTHGSQAMEMALNETYDLGQDFGTRYVEEIEKIDANRVMEIARKYILPEHYVMVCVGAK